MILNIYAIYDSKTQQYGNPMFQVTNGSMIRGFANEVNKTEAENMLNKHPEDFTLHHLGTYETNTGVFETHLPTILAAAKDLLVQK